MPVATAPNIAADAVDGEDVERVVDLGAGSRRSVALKHRPPATRPMMSAPPTVTKPEAGVIATRPATAPQAAPTTLTLREWR